MATDFLDEKRSEIAARLSELKPLVAEHARLEAAAAALDAIAPATTTSARAARPAPARAPASRRKPAATATGRRGRPKGSGKRSKEALALVTASPGITITELAEKMGVKQNYLYRVLPGLAESGLVRKDGRGWHPRQAA